MIYRFDEYEVDTRLFEIRARGVPCPVEPQVYEVLAYLLAHHDRLVTKEELLDHVWPERYITEAALNSRMMAARKVLGDNGRAQRYIKTVHGRGYRFVGDVSTREAPAMASGKAKDTGGAMTRLPDGLATLSPEAPGIVTGRTGEHQRLVELYREAVHGTPKIVFVSGEPGIGKTTLVRTFLSTITAEDEVMVACGQCIDYRGTAEAYMPVLEAFGALARQGGKPVIDLLAQRAPSWLRQLPWLVSAEELERLNAQTAGATPERMLREMLELLDGLVVRAPLILVLEDVHWSDNATVDLIDAIARREAGAGLMVIVTCRPADAATRHHPLTGLHRDLCGRGYASDIALSRLDEDAIAAYVQERFPGCPCPPALTDALLRRTQGNPLFMERVLDHWLATGAIAHVDGAWTIPAPSADLTAGLPDSLRDVIELQLDAVDEEERELLAIASTAGLEFPALAVAAGSHLAEEDVETKLATLARRHAILEERGEEEFPDGTICSRFAFGHELYREVLYDAIPAGRQARIHRAIGDRLSDAYGAAAPAHAAELAMHFLRGRSAGRACEQLGHAASQALVRGAPREAIVHLSRALDLIHQTPGVGGDALELGLRTLVPSAIIATQGFAAPGLEAAYEEALVLAKQLGDETTRLSLAYSLAAVLEYRGQHKQAYDVLSRASADTGDGERLAVEYHALLSCTHFHRSSFAQSVDHGDSGLALDASTRADPRYAALGEDPGVGCHEWSSLALWFLGYPDRSLDRARAAVRLASAPERAYSLASANTHLARVHQLRREPRQAREVAARTALLAQEFGVVYHAAVAFILQGWSECMLGIPGGFERLEEGMQQHTEQGAELDRPYFLALQAEALLSAGQPAEALARLDEALRWLPGGETYYYHEAEIHRLSGECALAADKADLRGVRQALETAIAIAREQGALSLVLRAAMSLVRLEEHEGAGGPARETLEAVLASFDEGFDTADLVDARTLLAIAP